MSDRDVPATHRADRSPGTTRRWFLAGAAAAVVGGAGGVTAELVLRRSPGTARTRASTPPALLVDALADEQALVRDLDATTGGGPAVRRVIVQVRADHAAHAAALRALIAAHPHAARPSTSAASPTPTGTPRTLAQLRDAERRAAASAARRAGAARGDTAALLASISACEATHADLLT